MAATHDDSKRDGANGRDDSSTDAQIPTGEKIGVDNISHVESADVVKEATAGVKSSQVYENMAPIIELNLPDWRATEKALVRRLDLSLMPTIWCGFPFSTVWYTWSNDRSF